jgi:hypothetical protein
MDLHDISRTAKTYGISRYFLVTPIQAQHDLIERILSHWRTEQSAQYHPDRFAALALTQMVKTFEDVKEAIRAECGQDPEVVMTDARPLPNLVSYVDYRRELETNAKGTKPIAIVFGTGWGIAETFYPEVHRILAPVYGPEGEGGYNHLSVRSAAAIILDRLFGK